MDSQQQNDLLIRVDVRTEEMLRIVTALGSRVDRVEQTVREYDRALAQMRVIAFLASVAAASAMSYIVTTAMQAH